MGKRKNKIYYLHIPKTAGTVLNSFLQQYISKACTIEHIESKKEFLLNLSNIYERYDFISGHIPIENIEKILHENLNKYQSIVTFRNPLEHVLSHLTYVKEILFSKKRFQEHDKNIQKIILKLNEVDFSKLDDLEEMIKWLETNNFYLFHNVQTVYLSTQPASRPVGLLELRKAMKNIEKLDFVGLQEELNKFMLMLAYYLDKKPDDIVEKKLNITNERYGLDITNKEVQKILYPLYDLDIILYDKAYKIFIDKYYDFVKLIELEKNDIFLKKYKQLI